MALDIENVQYYNTTIGDSAGEASRLLSLFADVGISLLAYKSASRAPGQTRFTLFPDDISKVEDVANSAGLEMDGPFSALLIKGDDESGALADIFDKLSQAGVNISDSSGIADINGAYGVVLYLNQEDCEKAMAALKM